ncbi:unnamed protein product [Darwinula stevensoni]|uniref:Uncharacterized protein n=1 Tax=Darwinula stevensoni TaxID=69355 RepID=A0A7R9AIM5_9CRUS|nr:unnamed protein product [Darwinula stevensoni]CAG0906122.1 unnamed protein product [Darwinula stevensoni]
MPSELTPGQYHAQDGEGGYAYGYVGQDAAKQEVRAPDGTVRGSYFFVDSAAKVQEVHYYADGAGTQIEASNIPQDPPDVRERKEQHLRVMEAIRQRKAGRASR